MSNVNYKMSNSNVKCQMSIVKWQMSIRLNLLSERASGVSPLIFSSARSSFIHGPLSYMEGHFLRFPIIPRQKGSQQTLQIAMKSLLQLRARTLLSWEARNETTASAWVCCMEAHALCYECSPQAAPWPARSNPGVRVSPCLHHPSRYIPTGLCSCHQ